MQMSDKCMRYRRRFYYSGIRDAVIGTETGTGDRSGPLSSRSNIDKATERCDITKIKSHQRRDGCANDNDNDYEIVAAACL